MMVLAIILLALGPFLRKGPTGIQPLGQSLCYNYSRFVKNLFSVRSKPSLNFFNVSVQIRRDLTMLDMFGLCFGRFSGKNQYRKESMKIKINFLGFVLQLSLKRQKKTKVR